MHALIVVAHPDPTSLTHSVAAQITEGVSDAGHSSEIADIATEGFDPRFNAADLAAFRIDAPIPADILAEQARVDRADTLVLVYPVYWWSMPGLLKGWIDRVFTNGWAYDDRQGLNVVKKLGHLPVHLVAIGAADLRTHARRGYFAAMRTQIDQGIFDFCGAPVLTSELLIVTEPADVEAQFNTARALGGKIFANAGRRDAAPG